ncbi:MAG: hypothetical protein EOO97_00115 [Pedobacter sp.]|nr:MAG: hypothetical protein EOO97_00115 [Pedobacter sp.]
MILAIHKMLAGKKVAYVTPEFALGKDFFKEILQYIPGEIITTDNKSDLYIELTTGGSLRFFSGQALQSLRGRSYDLLIVDEAAFIPDLAEAWDGAMSMTLGQTKGEAVFISTPRGVGNFFHTLYLKGVNREDGFESFYLPTNENPHFPPEEFEAARKRMPAARFREELLAIPGSNSNALFQAEFIQAGTINELSQNPAVVYGIDVASVGGDWTVVTGLDEHGVMCYFDRFQLPFTATVDRLSKLPANTPKIIDATGAGMSMYQQLLLHTNNLKPFVYTSQSKPKLILELVNAVEKNQVFFNETTANEMSVFEAKLSTRSNQVFYNAMAGCHDDCVNALALAWHRHQKTTAVSNWKGTYRA